MRVVQKALTFDDVLLLPAHSHVLPRDVSLKTKLTRTISLNIPLVSAAMDTVTEARLAIAVAQEGGIGIVHKNMTPRAQAAEVAKVKRFESGVVKDPITISQNMTVRDVLNLTAQHKISGLPVGAAIGVGEGTEERAEVLIEAGVDVIVVDTAHGHAQGVLDRVKWMKKNYPKTQIIGGKITNGDDAQAHVDQWPE